MQISARNQLEGIIREIHEGPINSDIKIEIAPEIFVTAQITTSSVHRLKLAVGKTAYAIIKADSVMVGVDD
ncbi:molybdopterin-binding protein [Oxalobacter aliiformigenes]|uniref:Molybdopterin-binding protein n=1 Tax=Oxalobacter aliiformigenes TaxID=2946593 RepID=A0A9E9LQL1_9BURK|nr:molybdopterin-binding protein [Oxalobacter aliiformigenes]MCZ4065839.1 molybdopterin-binding protein [Oxalobacter aliiformigenes]WAV91723.1 molybdopterin-binding protein [Oxalobacter aliiformigenes]WAV98707.1 molybdopterin-binding protein [Oxalobacter aliiformigenes]